MVGSLVIGTPPDFDTTGAEVASHVDENRTRIQVGAAIHATWAAITEATRERAGNDGAVKLSKLALLGSGRA